MQARLLEATKLLLFWQAWATQTDKKILKFGNISRNTQKRQLFVKIRGKYADSTTILSFFGENLIRNFISNACGLPGVTQKRKCVL